jgi:hypothetical protein
MKLILQRQILSASWKVRSEVSILWKTCSSPIYKGARAVAHLGSPASEGYGDGYNKHLDQERAPCLCGMYQSTRFNERSILHRHLDMPETRSTLSKRPCTRYDVVYCASLECRNGLKGVFLSEFRSETCDMTKMP